MAAVPEAVPDESGLAENNYDVQVTLSNLQDTDNPLSSAKDFKDLNLFVNHLMSHRIALEASLSIRDVWMVETNNCVGERVSTRVYWP